MSIETLKQQARRYEQDEDWLKALDQYQKAIKELEKEDQTDIGLINRVGDLFVRVGKLDQAVQYYEQAVELYREAFLPNNAIAVCKKIIRNVPDRHQAYLKIGQIRAEQGFLPDARTHFLTYAERMQKAGNLDESFRALIEFCDLVPDDVEVRITVADQMAANQRKEDAVKQLLIAYRHLMQSGETDVARGVEAKIKRLDPNADLAWTSAVGREPAAEGEVEVEASFGEIEVGPADTGTFEVSPELAGAAERFVADAAKGFATAGADEPEPAFSIQIPAEEGEQAEEDRAEDGAFDLPLLSLDEPKGVEGQAEEEEEGFELPLMSFEEAEAQETEELPLLSLEGKQEEAASGASTFELPAHEETREPGLTLEEAIEEAAGEFVTPSSPAPEAVLPKAAPSEPPPPQTAPAPKGAETAAPPPGGYVDLGAMILGGLEKKKTTRFRVAYEEPTGDEQADFAKMLAQFKEKVSENIDVGDVRAHYDLGTAYKEMGLLEEAISAFQAALRAAPDHLPTYELMGQTFIEMGQPEAAVRTLQRALQVEAGVEDEFVGIYYYLARAFEVLDRKEAALEYYDRVFALDINFADVTERLRELR
jgi:tetratricopeptide (TPR) repeat protein